MPNYVPEEVFGFGSLRDTMDDRVAVGWTGFTATHPGDLRVVGGAVKAALEESGAIARVIADAAGAAADWGLSSEQIEGIKPLKLGPDYFMGITTIDVGLVPLADNTFNRAKSSLKALEFSAMGVPVIATPTPANRELAKDVPMLLASNAAEWYDHILTLVESKDLRQEMGQQAREAVRARWTIEGHAERWARLWERAVTRRAKFAA
jgi:glycosyltransferase involved in cell wall biosynthesis